MNEDFKTRLNILLADKSLKTKDLVELSGLSKQAIYDILNGKVEHYNKKLIDNLTAKTQVNLNWLLLGEGVMYLPAPTTLQGMEVAESSSVYHVAKNPQSTEPKDKQLFENTIDNLNRLIEEKDQRIKDLQGQIEFLKDLVNRQ